MRIENNEELRGFFNTIVGKRYGHKYSVHSLAQKSGVGHTSFQKFMYGGVGMTTESLFGLISGSDHVIELVPKEESISRLNMDDLRLLIADSFEEQIEAYKADKSPNKSLLTKEKVRDLALDAAENVIQTLKR